jgi:hypothetical protein
MLGAASVVAAIALVPLADSFGDLIRSVLGYHSQRGIQVESTWGLLLQVASRFGYDVSLDFNFGALHVAAGAAPALESLGLGLSVACLVVGTWRMWRRVAPDDVAGTAAGLFGTLALVLAVGTVLSPQFLLWAIALGAAAACAPRTEVRAPALLLVPAAALSQLVYPLAYPALLAAGAYPLLLLGLRNGLIAAAGTVAIVTLGRSPRARSGPRGRVAVASGGKSPGASPPYSEPSSEWGREPVRARGPRGLRAVHLRPVRKDRRR